MKLYLVNDNYKDDCTLYLVGADNRRRARQRVKDEIRRLYGEKTLVECDLEITEVEVRENVLCSIDGYDMSIRVAGDDA